MHKTSVTLLLGESCKVFEILGLLRHPLTKFLFARNTVGGKQGGGNSQVPRRVSIKCIAQNFFAFGRLSILLSSVEKADDIRRTHRIKNLVASAEGAANSISSA